MNIFLCMDKIFNHPNKKILSMPLNEFVGKMDQFNFSSEELVIVLGIIFNKQVIEQTKVKLNLVRDSAKEDIITDFAIFAYIFIGDEYNDRVALSKLKVDLQKDDRNLFLSSLNTLISDSSRIFHLFNTLGNDNDRANMFAINALLNIKRGLGLDNFHITLFTVYQSLELKLKQCLKKYIGSEPSAQKKQIIFHNLVRLIKLISTSRVTDVEMADILKCLREYLRYFEKINPGGQAARYESAPNINYFEDDSFSFVSEKELLENFVQALNLLQRLYLKLIEIYDSQDGQFSETRKKTKLNSTLASLIGASCDDTDENINNKLNNLLDYQIFGDYQELINLNYQELTTLRFLIRIGFYQKIKQGVIQYLKK